MTARQYIRDHLLQILCMGCAVSFMGLFLYTLAVPASAICFLVLLFGLAYGGGLWADYRRRRQFYRDADGKLEALDQKYLLCEMLEEPGFAEGDMLCEILRQTEKSMADAVAAYRNQTVDYREYIETWVHEIKTPIAAAKLLCENNRSPLTRSLEQELQRVDGLIEQALYYARSNGVEKDYAIRACTLEELVDRAVKQNARALIQTGFSIQKQDLDISVFADPKWMAFILGQMIGNSIQYRQQHPVLRFSGEKLVEAVVLTVSDNGVGIPPQDIGRVFEKGFTGENGRTFQKSTGIGLYLCKKLCDKMGLSLTVRSKGGTSLRILFPLGSHTARTLSQCDETVSRL